jgi:hypothetical protein
VRHTKKNTEDLLDEIVERLDLIINVLALQVASNKGITEGARLLKMAGLDNQTIASVLNTSVGTIRAVTANLRVKLGRRGR